MGARREYLIGIDSGTQSTTACAWSLPASGDGKRRGGLGRAGGGSSGVKLVAKASSPLAVSSPRPGWAEQDPRSWWRSAREALGSLTRRIGRGGIAGVGLAFQRETFALLDSSGRPVRPAILWLDVRASREVEEVGRKLGRGAYHRATGKPLDITSAIARMTWLRRHERARVKRAAAWTDVAGYLAYRLTGDYRTCVAGADTCGLVDLKRRSWAKEHLKLAGLASRRMPDLVEPGEVIGCVTRSAARETGLPEGVPVVAAGGDGQVFNVGVGATAPGEMSLTLGTSVVLGLASRKAPISPLFRTLISCATAGSPPAGGTSGRPGDAPAGYLLECVLQSGTYLLRWFVETFTGEAGRAERAARDEAYWDRLARKIPPGSEGPVTLPNWWGVRFPEYLPEARGVTLGWSNEHTQAHLYRSLLEGIAFELRRAVVEIEAELEKTFPGELARVVRAGGGGVKSRILPRMLADVLGRPVAVARESETTALGAAILAGVGAGLFESVAEGSAVMCPPGGGTAGREFVPDRKRSAAYGEIFEKVYAPLLKATLPVSKALSQLDLRRTEG